MLWMLRSRGAPSGCGAEPQRGCLPCETPSGGAGGELLRGVSFEWSAAEEALRFIEIEGSATRRQVEVLLGVGQTTAGKLLRTLVEEGAIRQEGRGPSTRYKLAG